MLRSLYDRTLAATGHPHAIRWLALIAFVESSIFPIPPDVMLVPMVLATPGRWFKIAAVCTLASVTGGLAGYAIGLFLFETVGRALFEFYGYYEKFSEFSALYNEWGAWIVFSAGLTPFPYKLITIASGVTVLDPMIFITASLLARGLRFFIIALLLWKFGSTIRTLLERYLGPATLLFLAVLIGGFIMLKYIL